MFTGIITDVGTIMGLEPRGDTRLTVQTRYDLSDLDLGTSVAVNGVCLTVVAKDQGLMDFDVSAETMRLTNLGVAQPGMPVNLERSLKLGDELGGHMVTGHVDGMGALLSRREVGDSLTLIFALPGTLVPYVAKKGSITVNGVSLTVNDADQDAFSVNIIPHTQQETNLGGLETSDTVNLEVDILARYVARMRESLA